MGRVLVIGIDGGDFGIIDPLLKKGYLPHFKKILQNGVQTDLTSTIHPSSEQAWPAFYTGTNNGKHGIYGYLKRESHNYAFRIINRLDVKTESIFHMASRYQKRVIVLGMPLYYPLEEINGYAVAGLFCPGKHVQWTYPPSFQKTVEEISPQYILDLTHCESAIKNDYELMEKNIKCIRDIGDVACSLLQKESWDLFTVVFASTDRTQHNLWKYRNTPESPYSQGISQSYLEIDRYLGKFLQLIPQDTTIFIVSDHGFCDLKGGVAINRILYEHGYLILKKKKILSSFFHHVVKLLFPLFKKTYGIRYKSFLKKYFPHFSSKLAYSLTYADVDWSQTKAFAVSSGNVCINLKDREPFGAVSSETYEQLRTDLIFLFKQIRDGTTPIFRDVYRREDIYSGEALKEAPDLIVHFADGYRGIMFGFEQDHIIVREDPIFTSDVSGTHAQDGIFIASGFHVKKHKTPKKFHILDIAPTILTLLGIKPPRSMDGKVLTEILNLSSHKFSSLVHNDEKNVLDRAINDLKF